MRHAAPRRPEEEYSLFRAVEGVRFHHGVNAYGFEFPGTYENGRAALRIMHVGSLEEHTMAGNLVGECVCNLTINLPGADIPDERSCFYVRDHDLGPFRTMLMRMGLFAEHGYHGSSRQFSLWTFTRCALNQHGEHRRIRQPFAVECAGCLQGWADAHLEFYAKDAVRRIATLTRAEQVRYLVNQ